MRKPFYALILKLVLCFFKAVEESHFEQKGDVDKKLFSP